MVWGGKAFGCAGGVKRLLPLRQKEVKEDQGTEGSPTLGGVSTGAKDRGKQRLLARGQDSRPRGAGLTHPKKDKKAELESARRTGGKTQNCRGHEKNQQRREANVNYGSTRPEKCKGTERL